MLSHRPHLPSTNRAVVPFVTLQPGERIYNPHEQVYLVCTEGGCTRVHLHY